MSEQSKSCPSCGKPLLEEPGCLRCAMLSALDAATDNPDAASDLRGSRKPGFAALSEQVLPWSTGRFRVTRKLGEGGMGTVYEAHDDVLDRTVALKMVRAFRFSSLEEKARFHREATAVAKLDHPHIVPVYEAGEHDGHPFLVMKLVPGNTLAQRMKQGRLPAEDAVTIVAKIAAAVQHAHERGVVHRDLKPSNILLDEHGEPWLTDFGMARLDSDNGLTATTAQLGTPHYMSPEQASGRAREVGQASDVWGLGAVLYHMLSGQPLFEGETPLAIMHRVATEPPPRWKTTTSREEELAGLIERCLQKEPAQRIASAGIFAAELGRWLRGEHITAARKKRSLLRWAAVFTVAGLAWVVMKKPPAIPKPRTEIEVTAANGELLILCGELDDTLWLTALPGGALRVEVEKQNVRSVLGGEHALAGVRSIRLDGGNGRNAVNIAGADGVIFPSLLVNGGAGDDLVSFTGPIVLVPDAGLEVDLQNDAQQPGADSVYFAEGSSVIASGSGSIVVRASRQILIAQADLQVVDGSLTLEANQQAEPVHGEGAAIAIHSGKVRSEGKGGITLNGRGGGLGPFPLGVEIKDGSLVQGGTGEALRITGRGLDSVEDDDAGVAIRSRGGGTPRVISKGADILITGTGGSTHRHSGHNRGIALSEGRIEAGGMGRIILTGTGGEAPGPYNQGILLISEKTVVSSSGGDVILDGTGGGVPGGEQFNDGVAFWKGATLSVGGAGKLTITGTGKNRGTGIAMDESSAITVEAGEIQFTAKGAPQFPDIRVKKNSTITANGGGKITIAAERKDIDEGSVRGGAR